MSLTLNMPLQAQLSVSRQSTFDFSVMSGLGFWLLLPLKLGKSKVESPSSIENCQRLLAPRDFMKMSFQLSEDCLDVLKVDIPRNDMFLDKVVVHLDMLCLSMEDQVLSKMDIVEIGLLMETSIFQNPFERFGFTCSHDRAPIFSLYAQ